MGKAKKMVKNGKRRSPEQIIRDLNTAETNLAAGLTIGDVCRDLDITPSTFHHWRKKYGNMAPGEAKRHKSLEDETRGSRRWLPSKPWTSPCSRRSPRETSDPGQPVPGRYKTGRDVRGLGATSLPYPRSAARNSALQAYRGRRLHASANGENPETEANGKVPALGLPQDTGRAQE